MRRSEREQTCVQMSFPLLAASLRWREVDCWLILVLNNLSTSSHNNAVGFLGLCDGTLSGPLAAIITSVMWKKDSSAQ